ncbi:MAG: hypothetical protein AMXMBFR58_22770 [Phycisphaerae bacterium]|nr:hypothetical protein [Phycisphaerales bacterium]MCK6477912.1 hypothetical protein [Phycisphaerales bacterium]
MQFIIFESTTEVGQQPGMCLSLCGDHDLEAVSKGDVVWVVTRSGIDRPVPALCGRLIADRVEPHVPGGKDFDPVHADCRHRLVVDVGGSERCKPFACEMIVSWDIWRQPFRGVRALTDEQGQTLDMEWSKMAREPR